MLTNSKFGYSQIMEPLKHFNEMHTNLKMYYSQIMKSPSILIKTYTVYLDAHLFKNQLVLNHDIIKIFQ